MLVQFTLTVLPVPAVGTLAPDFSLPSTSGAEISLSSFRGKQSVLIAFYPLAFTSTCTKEMCAFRDDYDVFVEQGITILPISVDSKDTLKEYKQKLGINVELLSDFKRSVSAMYGVLMLDRFYANRSYFFVDTQGILQWVHVEAHPGLRRENSEILEQIRAHGAGNT